MAHVIEDPDRMKQYFFRSNLGQLELEIYGIKFSRGRSAYVQLKEVHNVKGSRRKVYNLLRDKYIKLYPDYRAPKELDND